MASEEVVLDEAELLTDLEAEISEGEINLLIDANLDCIQLITLSHLEFARKLSSVPKRAVDGLWNAVSSWRTRNGLDLKVEQIVYREQSCDLVNPHQDSDPPRDACTPVSIEPGGSDKIGGKTTPPADSSQNPVPLTEPLKYPDLPTDFSRSIQKIETEAGLCDNIDGQESVPLSEPPKNADLLTDFFRSVQKIEAEADLGGNINRLAVPSTVLWKKPVPITEPPKNPDPLEPTVSDCTEPGPSNNINENAAPKATPESDSSQSSAVPLTVLWKKPVPIIEPPKNPDPLEPAVSDCTEPGPSNNINKNAAPKAAPESDSSQSSDPSCSDEISGSTYLTPNLLKDLLSESDHGRRILGYAEKLPLSKDGRTLVADTVVGFHLATKRKNSSQTLNDLADVIVRVFPKELKETYYCKVARGNPRGKLFNKINYQVQNTREKAKKEQLYVESAELAEQGETSEVDTEVSKAIEWLRINTTPWSTVLAMWEQSFEGRRKQLRQFNGALKLIESFPQLQQQDGYQLLDIDYRCLNLGNPADPVEKWHQLFGPIAAYVTKNARDPSHKRLVHIVNNGQFSSDVRIIHLLKALHTVLIPVKAGRNFKPTVPVAQDDTFILAANKESGLTDLSKLLAIYGNQKIPVPPKLIVEGESMLSITGKCWVIYKSLQYELTSVARGIDVLLKLQIVLRLPVSRCSKLLWIFLEKFLYGSSPADGDYLTINKLTTYLDNQNSNNNGNNTL